MRRSLIAGLAALTLAAASSEAASAGALADVLSPRVGAPTRCIDLNSGWLTTEVLFDPDRVRIDWAVCGPLRAALRRPATGPAHPSAWQAGWAMFEVAVAGGLVATDGEQNGSAVCWAGRRFYRFVRPFTVSRSAARRVTRSEIRKTDAPRRCWPLWAR